MTYKQVAAGKWIRPRRKFYRMVCCDCDLVHKVEFKITKSKDGKRTYLFIRSWRDDRATKRFRKLRNHSKGF